MPQSVITLVGPNRITITIYPTINMVLVNRGLQSDYYQKVIKSEKIGSYGPLVENDLQWVKDQMNKVSKYFPNE